MSFPNPRLHTVPAERLRARCVFAERFVSTECVGDNSGIVDTVAAISRGATVEDANKIVFPVINCRDSEKLTIFFKFKVASDEGGIANQLSVFGTRFEVSVIDGNIKALHTDSISWSEYLSFDVSYFDGEYHSVMYIIDTGTGTHELFFDNESHSANTSVAGTIAETEISFWANQSTTYKRGLIFNDVLDADDFMILSDERWFDFTRKNLAFFWRCNERTNDTTGKYFRDTRGDTKFILGDGSTESTFPDFSGDNGETFFEFDSAQYLSEAPSFPDEYTLSVVHSDTVFDGRFPAVTQENSTKSIIDSIGIAGGYAYDNLHAIHVTNRELFAIEKLHLEHTLRFDNWRSSCVGALHQFINEDVCRAALLFNCPTMFRDIAYDTSRIATRSGLYTDGTEKYIQFLTSGSYVRLPNLSKDVDISSCTWAVFGDLSNKPSSCTFMSKGPYSFQYSSNLRFAGSAVAISEAVDNAEHFFAVSAVHGYKARFFADDLFVGEGAANAALTTNNTDQWTFGNNSVLTNSFQGVNVKAFVVFDCALTDAEVISLYHSLKRSFDYQKPASQPQTIWYDGQGNTEIKLDGPGNTTIINDEVA